MPDASNSLNLAITPTVFLYLVMFLHSQCFSSAMVLRLHARALGDLAELTRQWMRSSVKEQFPLRSHSRHLAHRLGNGRLQLHNLTVVQFSAPTVRYQPSKNSLLYLATDGGSAEMDAQWSLQSDFLLSILRSPAFSGSVRAKISGFSSDVSIKVAEKTKLVVHQCIARFDDFQLQLGGSLAADLIHWFHRPLAQAMQSHVEETYCNMIGDKLLPWLREQLAKLALKLHMEFGPELHLIQWLHSIRPANGHLDLRMAQRLTSSAQKGVVLAEMIPDELSSGHEDEGHSTTKKDSLEARHNSVSFLLPERALQQVFSGAHLSRRLRANFSSPFLRTSCSFLCIGKIVPQMRSTLGSTHLLAVVRTNTAPIVRLLRHRIRLMLNVSFELFQHQIGGLVEGSGGSMLLNDDDGETEQVEVPDNGGIDANNEHNGGGTDPSEDPLEEGVIAEGVDLDMEREADNVIGMENVEGDYDEGEAEENEGGGRGEEGTLIEPKLIGVGSTTSEQSAIMTPTFKHGISNSTMAPATVSTTQSNNWEEALPPGGIPTTTMTTRPYSTIRAINNNNRHLPVVRIVMDSELELLLVLDRARRRVRTELSVKSVRAVLAQSQMPGLSQKTMDLMLDASVPFLENAVRIFYRDGLELDDLLQLPTRNESVHIEPGFIQLNADLNLAKLLQ